MMKLPLTGPLQSSGPELRIKQSSQPSCAVSASAPALYPRQLANLLLHFLLFHFRTFAFRDIARGFYLALDAIPSERAAVREIIVGELFHAFESGQLFLAQCGAGTLVLPKQLGRDSIEFCRVGVLAGCED